MLPSSRYPVMPPWACVSLVFVSSLYVRALHRVSELMLWNEANLVLAGILRMNRRSHLDLILQLEGHHLQEIFSNFPGKHRSFLLLKDHSITLLPTLFFSVNLCLISPKLGAF